MKAPLLSIVVSTYNQENYLDQCLQAIVDQREHLDMEIIIADDCSTDMTFGIAESWCSRYPQIFRILRNASNEGANRNYLRGHLAALGEFVAHIDGDDVPCPSKFAKQLAVFIGNSEVNLVIHSSEYISDEGSVVALPGYLADYKSNSIFTEAEFARWGTISVHSSFMYRRCSLDLSDIACPFMEWSLGMRCLATGLGVFINERLTQYRFNPGGAAWTASYSGRKEVYEIQWHDILQLYSRRPQLRSQLYAQAATNLLAMLRAGAVVPHGLVSWLILHSANLRVKLLVSSIITRYRLSPK